MAIEYPTITKVDGRYGAPMGREAWKEAPEGPVKLFRLPLEDGAYDFGGAYWGAPDNLWCATDGSNFRAFVRAETKEEAEHEVLGLAARWGLRAPFIFEHDALSDVVTGYIRCLFFTHEPDGDYNAEWEDVDADDLSPEAFASIERDCTIFLKAARLKDLLSDKVDYETLGVDLFFSRHGHGCGLWDRPEMYGEEEGDKLDNIAKAMGETYPEVGDDGKVHL